MKKRTRFPRAINPARVGRYPATAEAGGGFVWDAVLEYRVWFHPEAGAPDDADGNDYYHAFASYPEALKFSQRFSGAEEPRALILQKEYLDEEAPGEYIHVKKRRIAEWPVVFSLARAARSTPFRISCRRLRPGIDLPFYGAMLESVVLDCGCCPERGHRCWRKDTPPNQAIQPTATQFLFHQPVSPAWTAAAELGYYLVM